jgi:hypothetical protein
MAETITITITRNMEQAKTQDAIKDEFLRIREQYAEASKKKGFNALIYGDFGTGKTYSLSTAPKPVLVHSFDPGGPVTLKKWIDEGTVYAEEFIPDPDNPQDAYIRWEKEFNRLRKMGFFEHIGTYAIDSLTTMSEAMMDAITVRAESKKGKREPFHREIPTFVPELQDYLVQQYTLKDILNVCCGLPCNFICIGHIDQKQDEVTGRLISTPMITGKQAQKIPLLFDEVYVADVKETSKGLEYRFLTQTKGIFRARSRLAASYNLELYEPQDIRKILKKCNFEYEDR